MKNLAFGYGVAESMIVGTPKLLQFLFTEESNVYYCF